MVRHVTNLLHKILCGELSVKETSTGLLKLVEIFVKGCYTSKDLTNQVERLSLVLWHFVATKLVLDEDVFLKVWENNQAYSSYHSGLQKVCAEGEWVWMTIWWLSFLEGTSITWLEDIHDWWHWPVVTVCLVTNATVEQEPTTQG